uniref:Uncharacterized protein n=1 Tax=Parascaris equorum TaxID=6256 RepID=A0A914RAB2_PAREQ
DDIFEERRKESDSGGDQGGVEAFGEATSSVPCDERADGIRMGPGSAVLVQQRSLSTSSEKAPSMPLSRSKKTRSQETEQDTDCLQRFLKIKVCIPCSKIFTVLKCANCSICCLKPEYAFRGQRLLAGVRSFCLE